MIDNDKWDQSSALHIIVESVCEDTIKGANNMQIYKKKLFVVHDAKIYIVEID